MKKEYFFIFAAALLIFAYVIDAISGPVNLVVKNPYSFLDTNIISKFPLTAVGILIRALGVSIGLVVLFSFFDRLFFAKAITSFVLAALFNLFAIQQIATNTRTVTIQWTLSLAYAGLVLLLPAFIYLILGFVSPKSSPSGNTEPTPLP